MSTDTAAPIEVFLSYSWDSDEHKQRVLELGQRLRGDGLAAQIDRFTQAPEKGWPQWMSDQIEAAKFVIVVFTETYARRFAKREDPGKGLGATWEGAIITQELYDAGGRNTKFIPLVFGDDDTKHIPAALRGTTHHRLTSDAAYEALYRYLTSQPEIVAAPLGNRRVLGSSTGVNPPSSATAETTPVPKAPPLPIPAVHNHTNNRVASTPIPHNLPTLQPFFGREDELRKIADALDPDSRTWGALIDGPGGMGKTSLAVRAAYDASPEVFKKIIFISLKTRELDDDGVRDLSGFILSGLVELLNELARELGCDDIAKAPEDQRPRLLLDSLRGTQTLLVLDNLESLLKRERDTLFTFVNKLPAGCKVILTIRGRIGGGGVEIILEKLSEEAALAMLAELATHNPILARTSEAERLVLYRETAGKPLLLRWTAGQLGRGHCLTFTDALHFIRSCPVGNDPLEFIFGDLVEDFDAAETQALCALTYFTLPAKVEHVAAIAGLPEPDTDRALRKLANRSLAVPTDELKTFTLVPMVADFLRKKKPDVVAETGDRLEKRAIDIIFDSSRENEHRIVALEAAWPGIAPALPRFVAGENARLQIMCIALQRFLNFQGHWDEWLALCEKAEVKALEAGDYLNAGKRAYDVGYIHSMRRQADAVLVWADRAAKHLDQANAGAGERATALSLRSMGHRLEGDGPAAMLASREAVELLRSVAAKSSELSISLSAIAQVEHMFGEFDLAEQHYHEALQMARSLGYDEGVATYVGRLADLSLERGDWLTAEKLAHEALGLSDAVLRQQLIATNLLRLAFALVRQGKATEALPHARRAVEIFTRLGSPDLARAQATLAECEQALAK